MKKVFPVLALWLLSQNAFSASSSASRTIEDGEQPLPQKACVAKFDSAQQRQKLLQWHFPFLFTVSGGVTYISAMAYEKLIERGLEKARIRLSRSRLNLAEALRTSTFSRSGGAVLEMKHAKAKYEFLGKQLKFARKAVKFGTVIPFFGFFLDFLVDPKVLGAGTIPADYQLQRLLAMDHADACRLIEENPDTVGRAMLGLDSWSAAIDDLIAIAEENKADPGKIAGDEWKCLRSPRLNDAVDRSH